VTVTLSSRSEISLEVFRRVAWDGEPVEIGAAALERAAAARAAFLRLLERPGVVVYGVTSGYGDRAGVVLDAEERDRQARAAAHRAASFGEPLPERVARGIVLARLANLLEGHAAAGADLLTGVAALLDGRELPPVPARGNGGSGEILALAHLFGPLIESRELGVKEGLALINGSPCAAALLADSALEARGRLSLAYDVFALSIAAFGAPLDAYDEALDGLWGDEHEARALGELRARASEASVRRAHQGPVAYRILPRVLGQLERVLAGALGAARVSLRSVTDNPVYVPPDEDHPDGRILSTGGYHNAVAPAALHQLAVGWAELCQLVERHVERLAFAAGAGDEGDELARLLSMVAVGYSEDARVAAQPALLPRGGPGQNDVTSPAFLAWRSERAAADAADASLATLAAAAARLVGDERPRRLDAVADAASETTEAMAAARAFGAELGRLAGRFRELASGGTPSATVSG
jgi:histidine ammonia-lyase